MEHDPIVVDIETCGLPNAADFIEPPDMSAIRAPSNYKDPTKIATYVAEAKAKAIADYEEACANGAALDWNVGRIATIGWWVENSPTNAEACRDEQDEHDALCDFWADSVRRTIVGFNIKGFDLRFLVRRSQLLGVGYPQLDFGKYSKKGIVDLYLELTFGDGHYDQGCMKRSLKQFCRRFGIPVNDTIDGKDIPGLVAAGEWDKVESHVRSDVEATVALARKLGVIRQAVEEPVI